MDIGTKDAKPMGGETAVSSQTPKRRFCSRDLWIFTIIKKSDETSTPEHTPLTILSDKILPLVGTRRYKGNNQWFLSFGALKALKEKKMRILENLYLSL